MADSAAGCGGENHRGRHEGGNLDHADDGIDRKQALALYRSFIDDNNLTSEQERYLKNILDYVSVNGDIETRNFMDYPLNALNWRLTFGDHFVQLKSYVQRLHSVILATA